MENSYFVEDHGINHVKVNKSKKSVSIPTFIISLIMVVGLVVLLFLKWNDILRFFGFGTDGGEIELSQGLSVGDEVAFSGTIKNDGDMVNYTHSYLSDEYGIIGLKSSKVNLNKFFEDVYFEGIVEKISHEIPIVNVTKIYDLEENQQEITGDIVETGDVSETNGKYLPKLGLYFGEDFFEKYSLVNEGDGLLLKIKDLETNIIYSINYFKCNTASESSENCTYLNDFYSNASSKKLVDKYGVSYYKDPEVNSWFFSNDATFGYKINDEDESFVRDLSTLMAIVSKSYVEKNVLPNIGSLCKVDHSSIEKVEKSELSYKNSNFYYIVEGLDSSENKINCELKIDPTNSSYAQTVSVNIDENVDAEGDKEDVGDNLTGQDTQENDGKNEPEKQETISRDPNVEQFPINLEKKLTFTSSRGHSFIFPSSNLAYHGVNVSEDFGQVGVNCFSAMNVVKYADKELVETQGNVVIYECSVKNTFDDSDQTLIYKEIGDKHFVIKINDPARVNFANNIEIVA